jgi:hypothetical protein
MQRQRETDVIISLRTRFSVLKRLKREILTFFRYFLDMKSIFTQLVVRGLKEKIASHEKQLVPTGF